MYFPSLVAMANQALTINVIDQCQRCHLMCLTLERIREVVECIVSKIKTEIPLSTVQNMMQ